MQIIDNIDCKMVTRNIISIRVVALLMNWQNYSMYQFHYQFRHMYEFICYKYYEELNNNDGSSAISFLIGSLLLNKLSNTSRGRLSVQ